MTSSHQLGNSADEQELLRPIALWAADFSEEALPLFESRHPSDTRPRKAIDAGREFGHGKKRDKDLRMACFGALKAGKDVDEPSKYVAQSAMLTAAVAYTHTDLQEGAQGARQARHLLGPIVYAALAHETAANGDHTTSDKLLQRAVATAPPEVNSILMHLPPQPEKPDRLNILFSTLDSALRN